MAIRRNYFFENITEEDPTKAVADPNLLDYDKTDSYSQTTPVGDEGVAGTVDTDLGDGKEEEIKGDGTPTLEQDIMEAFFNSKTKEDIDATYKAEVEKAKAKKAKALAALKEKEAKKKEKEAKKSKNESAELDFDTYMESIFADAEDGVVSESIAPEPQAIVFEGETDMEYMIAQAMNESYAQDLAIMEFIASGYETMEMLREADEDTKAAVKDSKVKKFKDTIVGAIKAFIEKVQGIFDSIIRFFKEKLGKDKVFIDKIEDPVMSYYNSGAAREPEKEQPKVTAHGNVVTTVNKKEDIPKEKGTEEIAEPDYNSIMQFMNMDTDKLNAMDFNPDEAAKSGTNKATHTILTAFGPKSFSPYGEGTLLEADEGKKRRVSVKEMFGKVREFFSKVFKFEKNKNDAKKKLKAVEKKLTNDKDRNPEEQKKILKAFSEFKQAVLAAIGTISTKAKNARSAFVRFFSKCAGKIFKGKQPKNEMAMALSESTLGMMIYEEYTSGIEYVAEEDVAQVADGVDVTEVIDGVIEKDETVTKEKTVSINNESYRVKVSATRL